MAMATQYHHATVDMGSNGIRCSISDLKPSTLRLLPHLYYTRFSISLLDAQYPKNTEGRQPIPRKVIEDVITALQSFQLTCNDFDVPKENIKIVATEATRSATNADEFLDAIKSKLGWRIELLTKEEEAVAGALGVVSSLPEVRGLVMDLGGGSVQLTCVDTAVEGWAEKLHENARSLPYGAAALLNRLEEAKSSTQKQAELKAEVSNALKQALNDLHTDSSCEPLRLYVSGGGFRGWGYLQMALRPGHPIAWVNGCQVTPDEFFGVDRVKNLVDSAGDGDGSDDDDVDFFRVSKRRLKQLPATSLIIQCLSDVLPKLRSVTFCQGGTQAGILVKQLSSADRDTFNSASPLETAVMGLVQPTFSVEGTGRIVRNALPLGPHVRKDTDSVSTASQDVLEPPVVLQSVIAAYAAVLYYHASLPKDIRPLSALHFPTSGLIGGAIGITHLQRATLALILGERWGGRKKLPPTQQKVWDNMIDIVGSTLGWWCLFLGRVGALIGEVWPAGMRNETSHWRVNFRANLAHGHLELTMDSHSSYVPTADIEKAFEKVAKLGKKKHWVQASGEQSWGLHIQTRVDSDKQSNT